MKIIELKEWLNNLSEDYNDMQVVIRELKEGENNKIFNRDVPITYGMVETNIKQLNLFDIDSTKIIEKIKKANENKIEGSIPKTDATI
jgi:hypothetical protein